MVIMQMGKEKVGDIDRLESCFQKPMMCTGAVVKQN
jgi:hypothetical protein